MTMRGMHLGNLKFPNLYLVVIERGPPSCNSGTVEGQVLLLFIISRRGTWDNELVKVDIDDQHRRVQK